MCNICGRPFFIPCSCKSALRASAGTCSTGKCIETMDAGCVKYKPDNLNGTAGLPNMGVPNGASLEAILERLDYLLSTGSMSAAAFSTGGGQQMSMQAKTVTTADLLSDVLEQLANLKQYVTNMEHYSATSFKTISDGLTELRNPNVSVGMISVADTVKTAIEKLATRLTEIAVPVISDEMGNQLQQKETGWFVSPYQFPMSGKAGNQLSLQPDGYYVNFQTNGMTSEQLLESLVNAGLNAEPDSTLGLKFKQLIEHLNS